MKRLKVAEARARFGEILDEAEKGAPVAIERRGVLFRIVAEAAPTATESASLFAYVDEDVAAGQWTWKAGRDGLRFTARRRR